jgi:hypothetical protein
VVAIYSLGKIIFGFVWFVWFVETGDSCSKRNRIDRKIVTYIDRWIYRLIDREIDVKIDGCLDG